MATILSYMRSPKPKDNARVEVMRDKNIALRETDIDTGRNSQEDLLTTEISSHSKGNNYLAESIRTEEVDAVVHFAGEGGEEERAAFQDAPSWARFLYKEIKQQRGEFTQLKSQFVSHKAVVNQRLGEYEKSAEHISERFDEFDAIKETMCKDIDSLLERREDLDEKLTHIMEKLDDVEQYSRRNCLLFTGIVEKDDENTDQLIMDTCREGMGIELSLQDIDRSHRIGMKTQREVPPEPEENGQVKHQKVRPIIVKFTSYRRRQQVFSAKKNLKGKHVGISENLTKIRQKIFNLARDVVGYKNVWSQDGKIFAKRHDDRIITMTKERDLYLIEGRMGPRHFKHYYQSYY